MDKYVYGVYKDNYEVMSAIEMLKLQGCEGSHLTVLAKDESLVSLTEEREPDVKTVTTSSDDASFMDKVMSFFSADGAHQVERQLGSCHLTDDEKASYERDLEEGKILLLLNRKTPLNKRLHPEESPTLQTMERYNSGLGLADFPEPTPYEEQHQATKESTYEQEERDAVDSHSPAYMEEKKEEWDNQLNDSAYEEEQDEQPDPYLKTNTNVSHL
ncbi:general stress protein [Bacillus testis]|uniref:general stress protein n=1 Tax=Bacillus testis TaxID=1622072 RepID=UPI00067EE8B4|nr:general stress protein [Bacillus testis]